MPEKNRFPAVLQPTAGTLGNRGLRSHTELDGHGAYIAQAVDLQNVNMGGDVAGTLDTTRPSRGGGQAVAIGTDCYNGAITGDVAATMGTPGSSVNASGPTVMQAVAFHPLQDPISSTDGSTHCMGTESSRGDATIAVAVAPSLTATNDPSRSPQSSEVTQQVAAVHASTMTVRRLSPRECERLQGFPDNWTLIPWRKKPAEECPDGPRYKALGNSMACNCMAWIGERIAKWEADHA
jgi:DNA (cytosine-5)-methyltransferase 1